MGKTVSSVNPQRKRLRFSKEFKLEAVRYVRNSSEKWHFNTLTQKMAKKPTRRFAYTNNKIRLPPGCVFGVFRRSPGAGRMGD